MSRIRKTSETRPLASHTVNAYSESESNAYSCDYANDNFEMKGTILYQNNSGATGNLTLNDDISNYTYYEIIPYGNEMYSLKNRVGTRTIASRQAYDGTYIYNATQTITLTGTSLTKSGIAGWYGPTSNPYQNQLTHDWLSIYQVIGYDKKTNTSQSTRSLNTYSGDIEEKKDIVIDDGGEEKPIDDGNDENTK